MTIFQLNQYHIPLYSINKYDDMTWQITLSVCNVICAIDDIECNVLLKSVYLQINIFVLPIGLFLLDFWNLQYVLYFALHI